MAQKLFPILADPNAPSSFDGLNISLSAGQMTAVNGADSFNMTASTLTANETSASWVDIVDLVVNPAPTPTLQLVLDTGNSANGANASISLLGGVEDADTSVLTNDDFTMVRGEFTSVLTASEATFSNATFSTNLSMTGVYAGEIGFSSTEMTPSTFRISQGASINQYTSDGLLINVSGFESSPTTGVFTNLQTNGLQVNDATHTTTVRPSQFTVLGQGALAGQMTELKIDRLQITNSDTEVNSSLSNAQLALNSFNYSSTLSSASHIFAKGTEGSDDTATLEQTGLTVVQPSGPTAIYRYNTDITEGNFNANLSSGQLTMTQSASGATTTVSPFAVIVNGASPNVFDNSNMGAGSLALTVGEDSLTLSPSLSSSAGGSSDQYLVITINGTAYRISLLSPPAP